MRPPLRNVFVQEAIRQRIPMSLLSFLMLYQMIFGFNFGCIKQINLKFKTAAQWFSFAMGCFMISILSLTFAASQEGHVYYWKCVSFVQYIPTFCILLSTKYTVCDFLIDLEVTASYKSGLVAWVYTTLMFVLKITCAVMYYSLATSTEMNTPKMIIHMFLHVPILSLDVIPVINSLLFYHIYIRMKDLRTKFAQHELTLERLEINYKEVADYFDKFRAGYDAILIWGFLIDSPKLMLVMWSYLHSLKMFNSWLINSATYVYAMHATLHICIPAVCAEMITAQTDGIKMILHERLFAEKEEAPCRLLRYMKARPLVQMAWCVLPQDLRLPIAMLSMCATYLIVIIQFTHLYD